MDQMLALDEQVFPIEHRINADTTRKRLEVNSMTDIAVFDNENLMGYISLYPVPSNIYLEIKSGWFDENKVELHTLPYKTMGRYDAYLCGIVIDKKCYPRFKSNYLFQLLQQHLKLLKKRGFYIHRIIAHAVSIAGRKTLLKMGFYEAKENLFIYHCRKHGVIFFREIVSCPRLFLVYLHPKAVDV